MTDPLWQASMMQCSLQPCGRGFTNQLFSSSSIIMPAYSQKEAAALIMLDACQTYCVALIMRDACVAWITLDAFQQHKTGVALMQVDACQNHRVTLIC